VALRCLYATSRVGLEAIMVRYLKLHGLNGLLLLPLFAYLLIFTGLPLERVAYHCME
jgi:hypothetical protein